MNQTEPAMILNEGHEFDWLTSDIPTDIISFSTVSKRKLRLIYTTVWSEVVSRSFSSNIPGNKNASLREFLEFIDYDRTISEVVETGTFRVSLFFANYDELYGLTFEESEQFGVEYSLARRVQFVREVVRNPFRPFDPVYIDRSCHWCNHDNTQGNCPKGSGCDGSGILTTKVPWLNDTILGLARTAYDSMRQVPCLHKDAAEQKRCSLCVGTGYELITELDPDRLAILADALEDADCPDVELVQHLRGFECVHDNTGTWRICENKQCDRPFLAMDRINGNCPHCGSWYYHKARGYIPIRGPHIRGCWAVDMLLGLADRKLIY